MLGKGAFSEVKLAINKLTGEKVALKTYDKFRLIDHKRHQAVQREIQIMKKLNHESIVKLITTIDCKKQLHLV